MIRYIPILLRFAAPTGRKSGLDGWILSNESCKPELREYIYQKASSRISRNIISQIIGKLITAGCGFLISLTIARKYGSQGYGEFVKITTFVAFFYLIIDFGLNAIYIQKSQYVHNDANKKIIDAEILGCIFSIRLLSSILFMILIIFCALIIPDNYISGYTRYVRIGIVIYSCSIPLQSVIVTTNAVFQKYLRYDYSALAVIAGWIFAILILFIGLPQFTTEKSGVYFAVVSLAAGYGIAALLSHFFTNRLEPIRLKIDKAAFQKYLTAALPLGMTLVMNLMYFRIDSVIITLFRSTSEVGVYGLAYKFFEFFLTVPTFIMNVLFPLLVTVNKKKGREKNIKLYVKKYFFRLIIISIIMTLTGWVLAPNISVIKSDFIGSILAFRILLLGLPLFFLSSLCMWVLVAVGKQKHLPSVYGLAMIFNIIINLIYIPQRGYLVAAYTTGISEALVLLLLGYHVYKQIWTN